MEEGKYKGLEVLVLDDEPMVCRSVKIALRRLGFEVEAFEDPELALRRFDEKKFDIVVTDIVMGDIDGIQVLEHVMQKSSSTKVIIITAFAMMDMARKAMASGAFDFIAKPFDVNEIRSIVARAADSLNEEASGA
ncbi:MAG: response regulator [Candidatus Latescibacteria bacterium]|nr:response regulator [Candidatus Latescibacterota bacterium]NIO55227.1 response regulator [Candidatus Latescibacterota bacterium]